MCISKHVYSFIKNSKDPESHDDYLDHMMDMLMHESLYEDAPYLHLHNYGASDDRACLLCNEVSNLVVKENCSETVICENSECISLRASLNINNNALTRYPNIGIMEERKKSKACISAVLHKLPKHNNGSNITLCDIQDTNLRMSILYIAAINQFINNGRKQSEKITN